MPHIKLNAIQTALGNAHGKLRAKIQEEAARFERYVAKKRGRFAREFKNGDDAFFSTLSESIGQTIPKDATVVPMPDGSMMLSWPDPPKAPEPSAEIQALKKSCDDLAASADAAHETAREALELADKALAEKALAPITPLPTNGQHEHAGAT